MMMTEQKFWMVVGRGTPVVKHASLTQAMEEASRLARENAGQRFTILQSVASVERADLMWSRHESALDMDESGYIPF